MVVSTRERVPLSTDAEINAKIRERMEERIRYYAKHPKKIRKRLRELDEEWDIERAIEANAAALAFGGLALGVTYDRRWLALPALVTAFLFQHAIQGWCPPVPILRRLGFRTSYEIEQERTALKAIRGDFDNVKKGDDKPQAALDATEPA